MPRKSEKKQITPEGAAPAAQNSMAEQLVSVIQDLAKSVQEIKVNQEKGLAHLQTQLDELKQKPEVQPVVVGTKGLGEDGVGVTSLTVSSVNFLTQVPVELRRAAEEVLGDKFSYECEACPDQPAFSFTVIVPAEYSPFRGKEVDRRTRVISNDLGANGVRDWCLKVKQNVLTYLGQNLTQAKL